LVKHFKIKNMKFRNNWKSVNKQWDKVSVRLRISSLDILTIEVDISREFYMFTFFNLTIKNR
jgi:hypothetical protein